MSIQDQVGMSFQITAAIRAAANIRPGSFSIGWGGDEFVQSTR